MRHIYSILGIAIILSNSACRKPVVGCMDAAFDNYDPEANEDDGCCCTIVKGLQDGVFIQKNFTAPFPNAPDNMEQLPTISLRARVSRRNQTAKGPCGCLRRDEWTNNLYSYENSSPSGTYGSRAVCYTDLSWYGSSVPNIMDSTAWNIVAAANGFDTIANSLWLQYTIRFEAGGVNDVAMQFTDTLPVFDFYPNHPAGVIFTWGGFGDLAAITHHIPCNDLPFTTYPIDNASVTIDLESIGFIP